VTPVSPGAPDSAAADPAAAILIVDDNAGKRASISAVVAPLGHPTVEVSSGEAALREVMQRPFAVILLDVQMPVMDGYETARMIRMRRDCEHTPIIFITAHTSEEAQVSVAYETGAVDFIFAPVVPDVLRAKVSVFIELFEKSRQLERSVSDVTALSNQFRDSEAKTRSVLENVADGIVTVDDEGIIQSFNRAATTMSGYEEDDAVGRHFSEMLASELVDAPVSTESAGKLAAVGQGETGGSAHSMGRRKDGSTFPMEIALSEVKTGTGSLHIACLRDISERQTYTETLQYRALHDDLTDLPNRVLFGDRVDIAIRTAIRNDQPVAVLLLDLNGFKDVNDTLGHECGDVLLQLVAERITGCLRDGDTVGRLGGDEFGILLLGDADLAGAASVAWKLGEAFSTSFRVLGHDVEMSASIGITLAPGHGNNVDDVLRRADLAMYEAKRAGEGHAVFAAEHEDAPARRLALLADLRQCVERDELVLHYQPKIDLATRRTVGVEALIRWNHPSRGLLMPGEFMPEVERNDLLYPITDWVINEAMQRLSDWRGKGYDLTMAVNIGARSLTNGAEFLETAEKIIRTVGVPSESLTFELTESALLDTTVPGALEGLQQMHHRLSIDDFGTGYSSLLYLQRLPVVEIKIDRSFVTPLASNGSEAALVRSIIDLAHNLDLTVVAEGVEDEETLDRLVNWGCDDAQGFFFSRAVPADDLVRWLGSSEFGATATSPGSNGTAPSLPANSTRKLASAGK
jgi:diguanylate cyclase (GGDEF)-like protein/PAS domain S-box-containing protein